MAQRSTKPDDDRTPDVNPVIMRATTTGNRLCGDPTFLRQDPDYDGHNYTISAVSQKVFYASSLCHHTKFFIPLNAGSSDSSGGK